MSGRRPRWWIALAIAASVPLVSCRTAAPTPEISNLLEMSEADLDRLFSASPPGPIPNGEAKGTAILGPGTSKSDELAAIVNSLAWQGKIFDAAQGTLVNHIGPVGTEAILAKVYVDKSLVDGKDCIVLDYSKTSLAAKHIRDEIRMIGPNTYLGPVYWDNKKLFYFALQFKG
ncbi:MAG: hypothetical protein AABO58_19900 [Acidobacteriota bacterium]